MQGGGVAEVMSASDYKTDETSTCDCDIEVAVTLGLGSEDGH